MQIKRGDKMDKYNKEKLDPISDEKKLKKLFKKYVIGYDRVLCNVPFYMDLINNTSKTLKGCKNILDIGCGTGNFTIKFAKNGANVLAIDPSEDMINRLKEKAVSEGLTKKIDIVNEGIENLKISMGEFDGVALINTLYLFEKPYPVLKKIYNSLCKDGIFVTSGPKPNENVELLKNAIIKDFKQKGILEGLGKELQIVSEVNNILSKYKKSTFTTERLEEILLDYIGFSGVIVTDNMPDYKTYLEQGHFISVKKGIDYKGISPEDIKIRFAKEDELEKIFKIRYYFTKEVIGVLEPTSEQKSKMMEWDEYDKNSYQFVAEYNNKILAIVRLVRDSKELKLPIDTEHNVDYLRTKGVVWEPGRWIALPFAKPGLGRMILRTAYEYAKKQGIDYFVGLINPENAFLYKRMGLPMDKKTSTTVRGYNTKANIEMFHMDNPSRFFKGKLQDPAIINFLESLKEPSNRYKGS